MIVFDQVQKSYQVAGRAIPALHATSMTIETGEVFGIVGHSGAGKSTLVRLINMLEPATGGRILIDNEDITRYSAAELRAFRRKVGMIFQHFNLLSSKTVADNIAFPMKLAGIYSKTEIRERVEELLARVSLSEHANKYPSQLSGGQKQRVGIARAIALNPKLIVADEPVSALDVSIQAQVINLLLDLKEKLDISYLFISHDLGVVEYFCDRVAVMYLGKIVELADSEQIYNSPQHPYTIALLNAIPSLDPGQSKNKTLIKGDIPDPANPPKGCAFHIRCPIKEKQCEEKTPALKEIATGNHVACFLKH